MSPDLRDKRRQSTLRAHVEFEGIGLHTGEPTRIVVHPANDNAGIVFRRWPNDAKRAGKGAAAELAMIGARPENVVGCDHGTTLANHAGAGVETVEHLMAAFALLGVDNAEIDVFGPEIPILDGSSSEFVAGFRAAGLVEQPSFRRELVIREKHEFADGERLLSFEPCDHFSLSVDIEFEDCLIGRQSLSLTIEDDSAVDRLANARTFCRLHEVDALRAAGLIRGGSLENSIVVDGHELVDGAELRDSHEFVWHKALDLIGDLYLLGAPIRGAIHAVKPGHSFNTRAALALGREYCRNAALQEPQPAIA